MRSDTRQRTTRIGTKPHAARAPVLLLGRHDLPSRLEKKHSGHGLLHGPRPLLLLVRDQCGAVPKIRRRGVFSATYQLNHWVQLQPPTALNPRDARPVNVPGPTRFAVGGWLSRPARRCPVRPSGQSPTTSSFQFRRRCEERPGLELLRHRYLSRRAGGLFGQPHPRPKRG